MPAAPRDTILQQAIAHHQAGRLEQAEPLYRQLVRANPRDAEPLHLLGVVEHQRGRNLEALDLITRAIALSPRDPKFHNNLAQVHTALGRPDRAADHCRTALQLQPNYPQASNNLGLALHAMGDLDGAVAAYRRAIELSPAHFKAWNNLGLALADANQSAPARAAFERAIALKPGYLEAHNNLANILQETGLLGDAEAHYRAALAIDPAYPSAHAGLGSLLGRQGRLDEALAVTRRLVQLSPTPAHHSNLLLQLHYAPDVTPQELFVEHRAYDARHAEPLRAQVRPHDNDRDPGRRLRVGYVSPDFREHPVAYFIEPVLAAHDRQQVELFCYASVRRADDVTARLRALADVWRDVARLDDAALADVVRADRIDVLVDLSVHLAHNRLPTFARKPAPVQMTYLGYPGTTGLSAMDYKISDPHLDPVGWNEPFHAERIARLPESYFCYAPPRGSPDVSPLPARSAGHVTFASVNTLMKVTPKVIETWATILARVPDARLLMQTIGLADPATRQRVSAAFASHGIDPTRLEMLGFAPMHEFLALLGRADVALDAFPYSSGTTTCHTLWMGIPVLTLPGQLAVHRMGLSVLSQVGLPDLAPASHEQYIQAATDLANDLPRLTHLRSTLRDRMRASPLMNGPRHAGHLEQLYRDAWREWCEGSAHA